MTVILACVLLNSDAFTEAVATTSPVMVTLRSLVAALMVTALKEPAATVQRRSTPASRTLLPLTLPCGNVMSATGWVAAAPTIRFCRSAKLLQVVVVHVALNRKKSFVATVLFAFTVTSLMLMLKLVAELDVCRISPLCNVAYFRFHWEQPAALQYA
jgi:hypothetical protein